MNRKIIIGSRGSKLAMLYAEKAKDKIVKITDLGDKDIVIKKITTKGDEFQDVRLSEVGGKGLFSSNIEKELQDKNIDVAVHALKDMPALETISDKTTGFPSSFSVIIDAAVSSQLVSIPRIKGFLLIQIVFNNCTISIQVRNK